MDVTSGSSSEKLNVADILQLPDSHLLRDVTLHGVVTCMSPIFNYPRRFGKKLMQFMKVFNV